MVEHLLVFDCIEFLPGHVSENRLGVVVICVVRGDQGEILHVGQQVVQTLAVVDIVASALPAHECMHALTNPENRELFPLLILQFLALIHNLLDGFCRFVPDLVVFSIENIVVMAGN